MLDWVATFIQKCQALRRYTISVAMAVEVFKEHIRHMLPAGESLSQMLDHLSGAACAAQLHACQDSPAGRGDGPALPASVAEIVTDSICIMSAACTMTSMTFLHLCSLVSVWRMHALCLAEVYNQTVWLGYLQASLLLSLTCWLPMQAQSSKIPSAAQCWMLGRQLSATQPQQPGGSSSHGAKTKQHHQFLEIVPVLCACASPHLDQPEHSR